MKNQGSCPLCGKFYNKKNRKTHHHIFPKTWFGGGGIQVEVCQHCHQIEFNHLYPMNYKWSREECLQKWSDFCKSKGKWMYQVYPELKKQGLAHL